MVQCAFPYSHCVVQCVFPYSHCGIFEEFKKGLGVHKLSFDVRNVAKCSVLRRIRFDIRFNFRQVPNNRTFTVKFGEL